jgi:hypothetical protein
MATYSLDLIFEDDRKSKLPHPPRAFVCVKTFSQLVADGPRLITPDCVSMQELDHHINRLIEELETIRKKAKAKFAAEDKRYQK